MKLLLTLLLMAVLSTACFGDTTVDTLAATNVQQYSALLNGSVVWTGSVGTAVCSFAWGLADGGTTLASWGFSGTARSRTTTGTYWLTVADLYSTSSYYFRAFASNTAGIAWGTNSLTFTTLSDVPTNDITWSNQTVMVDSNGVLVSPTDFFQKNGVTPTQDITALTAAVVANAGTIAAILAGQPITSRMVVAAVPDQLGAQLVTNPELLSNWGWTIGAGGSWNSANGGRVLVPEGNFADVSPSNGIAYQAGWGLKVWWSNDLPSTGSLAFAVSGDTQTRPLSVGSSYLLLWPTSTGTLTVTLAATNGDSSLQSIYVAQVTNGGGHFAQPITTPSLSSALIYGGNLYTRADIDSADNWTNRLPATGGGASGDMTFNALAYFGKEDASPGSAYFYSDTYMGTQVMWRIIASGNNFQLLCLTNGVSKEVFGCSQNANSFSISRVLYADLGGSTNVGTAALRTANTFTGGVMRLNTQDGTNFWWE